jgi:hypothetical protein
MKYALVAAGCMVIQDILATFLVISESKGREWLAGALDAAMWLFGIVTTSHAVAALNGHNNAEKWWILGLVSVANVVGTVTGVKLGERLIKRDEKDLARENKA